MVLQETIFSSAHLNVPEAYVMVQDLESLCVRSDHSNNQDLEHTEQLHIAIEQASIHVGKNVRECTKLISLPANLLNNSAERSKTQHTELPSMLRNLLHTKRQPNGIEGAVTSRV